MWSESSWNFLSTLQQNLHINNRVLKSPHTQNIWPTFRRRHPRLEGLLITMRRVYELDICAARYTTYSNWANAPHSRRINFAMNVGGAM